MLRVEGLLAGYDGVRVLHGLNLQIRDAEFVGLLGPNGHGKSTLLRSVSGLLSPDGGRISFDGRDITDLDPAGIVDLGVIHVPQGDLIFPAMTVENNLLMGAQRRAAWPSRFESLEQVLQLFPRLRDRRRQVAGTLSGGERRMLAIARGLMAKPRLLMVDEPSLGLAPTIVRDLYEKVREIREQGVTMLVVEEQTQHIQSAADRFYLLENGQLREHGVDSEGLDMESLLRAYLAGSDAGVASEPSTWGFSQ